MERSQFNIDRLLRSKLSRPVGGPDDAARSSMEQMLREAAQEKRRKKRGFWWFFIVIGLAGLSLGIWEFAKDHTLVTGDESVQPEVAPNNSSQTIPDETNHAQANLPDKSDAETEHDASTSEENNHAGSNRGNAIQSTDQEPSHSSQTNVRHISHEKSIRSGNAGIGANEKTNNTSTTSDASLTSDESRNESQTSHDQTSEKGRDLSQPEGTMPDVQHNPNDDTAGTAKDDSQTTPSEQQKSNGIETTSAKQPVDSAFAQVPVDSSLTDIKSEVAPDSNLHSTLSLDILGGVSWSRFQTIQGTAFAINDRETAKFITGFSPDLAVRGKLNRWNISAGFSSFTFNESINNDSIRVADGQVIVVDGEFATIEYYDTELDEKLKEFSALTSFSCKNFRLQGGYDLLKEKRIQIAPSLGLEYQRSQYEALRYERIGFYILVEDTDPPVDYYTIWHNKKQNTFSNTNFNGLASIEFSTLIGRHVVLSFEPIVHIPLYSSEKNYPESWRLDLKLAIGYRLFKS